ncbi:hypothetical protein [Microtetraspora sp. NBRC 13810]|uniref:hypothetical protein n=1 Tax=Microtetraspora sp. NBRC 13810 TaxID=3030990 RepID=UPI002554C5EE|nr:hypothetical protein [Microtetraspora sp. NBRC 13810]
MLRAALGALSVLAAATGCAQPTAGESAVPLSWTQYTTDPCRLVPVERMGDLLGLPGVRAQVRTSQRGSELGACAYTSGTVELTVEVHERDPSLTPDEYVKAGTYHQGRALQGLGDAAAVARLDQGWGQLVLVKNDIALFLAGDTEITDGLAKVAGEAVHALPRYWRAP